LPGGGSFKVRTLGGAALDLLAEVLKRTSHIQIWNLAD